MKNLKFYLLLGLLFLSISSCERDKQVNSNESSLKKAEIIFDKTFPEIKGMPTRVIVGNNDNFFLIGDETGSIISVEESGEIKWSIKKCCIDLVPTENDGCIIVFVEGTSYYDRTFHLAKLNSEGAIEWEKSGEYYKGLSRIVIGKNGEIYGVADVAESNSYEKPLLIKYTKDGDYISATFLTYVTTQISYKSRYILQLSSNNIVVGTVNSWNGDRSDYDFNIIECDVDGHVFSERHYGGYKDEFLTDIIELPNNELAIVGSSDSKDGDIRSWREELTLTTNAWAIKLNSNRDIIWEKIMGGSKGAWFAKVISKDNKLLIAFETASTDVDFDAPETSKFGYVTFNSNGDIEEKKYVGHSVVWTGIAGCAYDSKGNIIMLSSNYDEYYGTRTLRILKIR